MARRARRAPPSTDHVAPWLLHSAPEGGGGVLIAAVPAPSDLDSVHRGIAAALI